MRNDRNDLAQSGAEYRARWRMSRRVVAAFRVRIPVGQIIKSSPERQIIQETARQALSMERIENCWSKYHNR